MSGVEGVPDHAEIQAALSRVLDSDELRTSPTLRKILRFVVCEELEGRGGKLKAFSIALDALGKAETFDPQTDPSVRVGVGRLRSALQLYYLNSGRLDRVEISVPKGSYRPSFSRREVSNAGLDQHETDETKPTSSKLGHKRLFAAIILGLALCIIGAWVFLPALFRFEARDTVMRASNTIKVRVQENAHTPSNETEKRETFQFLRGIRSALLRNDTLSIILPEQPPEEGAPERSNSDEEQPDYSVVGIVQDAPTYRRVSVELINGHTNELVWARTHQLRKNAASERVVAQVVRELSMQILGASISTLQGRDPETLSAAQLFVLANWVPGPAKNSLKWEQERVTLARLAIKKDAAFGPAYSVLADKLAYLSSVDGPSDTPEARQEAQAHWQKALELAPGDANVLFNVAQSQWHSGMVKDAIRSMKRVLELDPNHGLARGLLIVIPYTCTVAPDDILQDAIAFDESLGPDNPIRWVTLTWLGWLHLNRGEFELALDAEKRAAQIFQIPYTVMRHAVILNKLGRPAEAAKLIKSQRKNWPNIDPAHFSNVTMPRLCTDFPGGHVMLDYYDDLKRSLEP
ncbi:MAG: hypothetical protein ABJN26_06035 [Stappiaceae bacterium]